MKIDKIWYGLWLLEKKKKSNFFFMQNNIDYAFPVTLSFERYL